MMPAASTTSIKLDPAIKERLQRLADAQRRSAHWMMKQAIEEFVEREETREQFRQDPTGPFEDGESTGLHLTHEEASEWLRKLVEGHRTPMPKPHR
jgi:predicted transcriptional regulator